MPSVSRGGSHDSITAKFSTLTVKFLGGPGTMYVKNQNHTWSNYICIKYIIINVEFSMGENSKYVP